MNFVSDNIVGASAPIMAALVEAAAAGVEGTYGRDRWSSEAQNQLNELFGRKVTAFFVTTGTAANALALQAIAPPGSAVFCHETAHVIEDECGAPEFFIGSGKLVGIPGMDGKITPAALTETLARFPRGVVRQVPPAALSLSQATECGTAYRVEEIAALADIAHAAGLPVHMDGARFGNALVELGCTAAAMTWQAGVDVLSFGVTKTGALACEAVVFFDEALATNAALQRKRGGHTLSKGRLLGAQMTAALRDDHWLHLARHANAMARRLAEGLAACGLTMPWPRQANEVFVVLPPAVHTAVQAAGAQYYLWEVINIPPSQRPPAEAAFARLICSFETTAEEVDAFLTIVRAAEPRRAQEAIDSRAG